MVAAHTISVRNVVAHNDAADSGNPMHDDAAAKAAGFKGALVPGVTAYGYLAPSLIEHFGEEWLDRGCIEVRFRRPVYVGDQLSITLTHGDDDGIVAIAVANDAEEICVAATASLALHAQEVADLETKTLPPTLSRPGPRLPATSTSFTENPVLGSWHATFPADENERFLDD
ncbi:MAG: MaoC family dehydratase, partial [Pseudomonadota bacterium]